MPPLCLILLASSAFAAPTSVVVRPSHPLATVPAGFYSVGYDGWHDILDPGAVKQLQDVRVHFCRIAVDLKLLCGDRLGDFRWEYTTPADVGVGFVSRVKRIVENGWTPMLALTTSHSLPSWFKGEATDANGKPWFKYNLAGSAAAVLPLSQASSARERGSGGEEAVPSDQWEELSRIAHGLAAGLAERGLKSLYWETIYEIGHTMPSPDLHYFAAKGIREADPTAKLIGPATWPGWTVEERFVKPYLERYGPDLLDYVSIHWYADNEHGLWAAPGWKDRKGPVTMGDRLFVQYLIETAPKYGPWCQSLRKVLDDPQRNPVRKPIGIFYSEFDCLATSPYQQNPENADWPNYRADADCYLNTNWFGGVWCAATLCSMLQSGAIDAAFKFTTRDYYGLIENSTQGGYFREPVWFAWKLLQDAGGLVPGAQLVETTVDGPRDQAQAHVGGEDTPWVMATAVRAADGLRIILINRSLEPQTVSLSLEGGTPARLRRFLYSQDRLASYIGPKPGAERNGAFEGAPDDSRNQRCLEPLDDVATGEGAPALELPPISITVLRPMEESAPPR